MRAFDRLGRHENLPFFTCPSYVAKQISCRKLELIDNDAEMKIVQIPVGAMVLRYT